MVEKRWIVRDVDADQRMTLARALSISPITAAVLLARGVDNAEQASLWLEPGSLVEHDPYLIPDMEKAVQRLHRAVRDGERICFYGDYDVDGISATSIFETFFRGLGAEALHYIPHREREGYGLNEDAVRRLSKDGVRLLVTSDCGTTSQREIEVAQSLGVDVIVTDHHQVPAQLPPALALLNPHRHDSMYPFKSLCSGGLAYKVIQAYSQRFGDGGTPTESFQDLVALSTIADVVPLQGENRRFVLEGLALITHGGRKGIRALKQAAGVERSCSAGTVAFRLAPILNAAGRLAHAEAAVRLLTTPSEPEATRLAAELGGLNRERQQIEEAITAEARASLDQDDVPPALVLAARHWHVGVVGIVAARLVERYHRPSVVIAIDERGIGRGSARSIPGLNLVQAFSECQDLLEAYGGHPRAAGLTLREDRISEFRSRFTRVVVETAGERRPEPTLHVDAEVSLVDVSRTLVRELENLQPFGEGNPEPTLAVRQVTVLSTRVVGNQHLKLTVRGGNSPPVEGIGFRMGSHAARGLSAGQAVDLAFAPELNLWKGLERIQLRLRDVKTSPIA
ncbi:MAG: single-stranded-DNA-specific exonuclease RecJ [Nitrospiraceae bacterium]